MIGDPVDCSGSIDWQSLIPPVCRARFPPDPTVITTETAKGDEPARQRFRPGEPVSLSDIERQGSLVLPGYSWDHYLSLGGLFQDSGVRVRFLDNFLEIRAPISEAHEERKTHIGCLIEAWCVARDIEIFGRGSATLKIPEEAGGEPDESYCFHDKKPRPDLVIEVALTSGGLSKRAFYAKFQIPELWVWRDERLELHVFDKAAGEYREAVASVALEGIDHAAVADCSALPSINQALREFRKRTGD